MFRSVLVFGALLASVSGTTLASGGYNYNSPASKPKPVDATYERGKAIYLGRAQGSQKIAYCIDTGTDKVKLKRSTLKPFKHGSVSDLTSKLYDCNNPETTIGELLSSNNYGHVIYYLNKRYRLSLSNG